MSLLFFLFATLADQTVAFVGDDVILKSEVDKSVELAVSQPALLKMFRDREDLRDYVLEQLISKKLLMYEAEQESITVSDEEVRKNVETTLENIRSSFPSEADFFKWLDEQHLSLEELRKYYEENTRTQALMQRLLSKKFGLQIMISPIAVKRFYEENKDSIGILPGRVKLAHILLAVKPDTTELKKAFERALDVYKLLYQGGDFATLAREFSEDENSRRQGGMLGRIKKGETFKEFESVVFNLKPGKVSEPFLTRLGYHIVEVLNKGSDWVLLRQILIKVSPTRADTLRYEKLAERIRNKVIAGADFESLAKKYSDDPTVELGEFYLNQLTPPFDTVVENLKAGDVSKPLLTPYGYHLIYVKDRVEKKVLSFEDLRDKIYQYLYQQELEKKYEALIDELKEKVFVKKF